MSERTQSKPSTQADPLRIVRAACWRVFLWVGAFTLGINLLMLASPLYMMQVYDRVLATRHVDTLIVLSAITAFALLSLAALDSVRTFVMNRLGAWLEASLAEPVLRGAVADALRAGGGQGAQGLRDLATLRGFLAGPAIFPLFDAPWAPVFMLIVFLMHPVLGWTAVIGAFVLLLMGILAELATRQPLKRASGDSVRRLNEADATVRNADVIAAMGLLPNLVRRWRETGDAGARDQAVASDRTAVFGTTAKFVRMTLQSAMLGVGAYLVIINELSPGVMIASSIIMARAVAPVEQAIGTWRGMIGAQIAYRRIRTTLERLPPATVSTALPRPEGALVAEHVTFATPRTREPLLKNVSFSLAPGEALGVIGPSGSGKTTLARLLVGSLTPSSGVVRLDGADVAVWDAADRGQYVGYLPQAVELFDGTVRENIAGFGEVGDDEIVAAAKAAGAHDLILSLPDGYETRVGAGGIPLSGGQRQRVALARALFRSPALIVLDEPNANLDAAGEQALLETMARLRSAGSTVVLITQRMGILAQMDKLLVLRQGAVEAFGPRDEILAKMRTPQPAAAAARGMMRPVLQAGAVELRA